MRTDRRKVIRIVLLSIAAVAVIGAGTWLLFMWLFPGSTPPSDGKMIRDFQNHRQQYEELLRMFQKDAVIRSIGRSPTDWEQDGGPEIPQEQVARYRSLLQELDLESIERDGMGGVELVRARCGLAVSGWAKAYVYTEQQPAALVGHTGQPAAREPVGEAWRRIEGNWYIFYSWDV